MVKSCHWATRVTGRRRRPHHLPGNWPAGLGPCGQQPLLRLGCSRGKPPGRRLTITGRPSDSDSDASKLELVRCQWRASGDQVGSARPEND